MLSVWAMRAHYRSRRSRDAGARDHNEGDEYQEHKPSADALDPHQYEAPRETIASADRPYSNEGDWQEEERRQAWKTPTIWEIANERDAKLRAIQLF